MHSQSASSSTRSLTTRQSHTTYLAVILILIGGFALRLFNLGTESLWYDETVSVYLAGQTIPELVSHTARDIHPPAYYLLLHIWRLISHPSVAFGLEFLYSWPSLFCSMLLLPLTYAITKRVFSTRAALWALAFASIQPAQIWFSQEVRMYALGALAMMLTLWAVSPLLATDDTSSHGKPNGLLSRPLYVLAALCGLYTLYYFVFWLVILNISVLLRAWKQPKLLRQWLLLQILVLIGWLPWFPIFIRQATDPPVPPWRLPWNSILDTLSATSEAISAYWGAHVALFAASWPVTAIIIGTSIAFYVYTKHLKPQLRFTWLTLCFGPIALLIMMSVVGPPLYHVRYVSLFAPLFAILLGVVLSVPSRLTTTFVAAAVVFVSALYLQQLWTNPLYEADDHRNAVGTLASEWRPGDAILVNAGWVYTALSVYWPTELPSPNAVRPRAISDVARLDTSIAYSMPLTGTSPIIIRSGSVDGESNLGWSLPQSDFFALSQEDTLDALDRIAASHARIWHYRLYDTVNDPSGVIRQWFEENTTQVSSQPVLGRDFLRLELYRTNSIASPTQQGAEILFPDVGVTLLANTYPITSPAGEMLFVNLTWDATASLVDQEIPALSLRLYDSSGNMLLQEDTPLTLSAERPILQSLALPVPADSIPAQYQLELLLYSPETLLPYSAFAHDGNPYGSTVQLGEVGIELPLIVPVTGAPLATFDYINLLKVGLSATPIAQGETFSTEWTWHPQPSTYRDQYRAQVKLAGADGSLTSLVDFNLGGDGYLSSTWPALYPLRQRTTIQVPQNLPPGTYEVLLSVVRASDSAVIPVQQGWLFRSQNDFSVGKVEVVNRSQE